MMDEIPLSVVFWPSCLLASIAHAVFVVRAPMLAHEQSWDGMNYNVQDSGGARGTISFGEDKASFVGVAYSPLSESTRQISNRHQAEERVRSLTMQIPAERRFLLSEALQYVLQQIEGYDCAVFSTAFWSDPKGNRVTSFERWPDVLINGGGIFELQSTSPNQALSLWSTNYALRERDVEFVRNLWSRRCSTHGMLELSAQEVDDVIRESRGHEGRHAFLEALREIQVIVQ